MTFCSGWLAFVASIGAGRCAVMVVDGLHLWINGETDAGGDGKIMCCLTPVTWVYRKSSSRWRHVAQKWHRIYRFCVSCNKGLVFDH